MGVFEDFIECDGEIRDNSWIEWDHYLIPNKESAGNIATLFKMYRS